MFFLSRLLPAASNMPSRSPGVVAPVEQARRPDAVRLVCARTGAALLLILFAIALPTAAQTVEDDQLQGITDIFTILWYFSLFCAYAAGFKTGLTR